MACSSPKCALIYNFFDGEKKVTFCSHTKFTSEELADMALKTPNCLSVRQALLPCGKCDSCKLEYSRQWAIRCVHESKLHAQNCFLTLTYSNENLPEDGKIVKKHLQDFFKRLRWHLGDTKIRYYAVGEYGSKNKRPHYHCILFGYTPPDCYEFGFSVNNRIFRSPFIEDVWSHGMVFIGNVTYESCAYVARYCMKKVETNPNFKEFSLMSRRPGIGSEYFQHYFKGWYALDGIRIVRNGSYQTQRIPRYYDKLYQSINPSDLIRIKDDRINKMLDKPFPWKSPQDKVSTDLDARFLINRERADKLHRSLHEDIIDVFGGQIEK